MKVLYYQGLRTKPQKVWVTEQGFSIVNLTGFRMTLDKQTSGLAYEEVSRLNGGKRLHSEGEWSHAVSWAD